jgi:hypothetical protein
MDPDYVLRWAHLGLARNPRYRDVMEKQRRIAEERVKEISVEQEALNAARPLSVVHDCHWLPATPEEGRGVPVTEHRLEHHVPPRRDAVAALNVLREAAGLGPWREDGQEVSGDGQGERGEAR